MGLSAVVEGVTGICDEVTAKFVVVSERFALLRGDLSSIAAIYDTALWSAGGSWLGRCARARAGATVITGLLLGDAEIDTKNDGNDDEE